MLGLKSFVIATVLFSTAIPFVVRAQETESEWLETPIVTPSDSGAYHAINQLPASMRQSAPFAREFYEFSRHAGTSGVVDNDAYIATFNEARQSMLRANASAGHGKSSTLAIQGGWSNIGLTGSDTTPSAGITYSITFDPQHSNVMYASGSGGLWKSIDTGATWENLTDNWIPNLIVASVAIDPVNTNTLYLGTGNCNIGVPNYGGSGIYKSTDGGSSFKLLPIPFYVQSKDTVRGYSFVKIVVDPTSRNIVLASSYDDGVLYRSTDTGTTWTKVSSPLPWDIIAVPASNGATTFYLICSSGVEKSTNDGATWTKVSTSAFPASIGRSALAFPAKAPNKILALMTDGDSSGSAFLFESIDSGTTWNSIAPPSPNLTLFDPYGHPQGWYDLYLAIAPNASPTSPNFDTIYVGGIDAAEKQGTNGWVFSSNSSGNYSDGGGGYTHVDHHSFAINPNNSNIVYDGNDGGLWVNYAAGSTSVATTGGWQLRSAGMVTSRFYHLCFNRFDTGSTWAGAQDQGMWKMETGQPPQQQANLPGQAGVGDAMQPLISPQNESIVYGEGPEGQLVELSNTWESIGTFYDAAGWDNPFKMSPISATVKGKTVGAGSILYVGRDTVHQTVNGGGVWTSLPVSFGLTPDGVFYCSAIALPTWNYNMIYAAGGSNSLKLSTNFGVSWVSKTAPGYITSINTTPKDTKFVVVTLGLNTKKVEMSDDSGKTWTDVSGPAGGACIPGAESTTSCNVVSMAIDSVNPLTTWYAGTDFGVYETTNAGQTWEFMGPCLVSCRDVQLSPNGTTLRVASFGRGIWEVQLPIAYNAVEQTSLTATKSSAGTALSWDVENEPAGATFYVERSVDGNTFSNVGTVAGGGLAYGSRNYTFNDPATAPGTYLYQIHEIDANGAQSYSNSVELHYGTDQLYLYQPFPNPFILNGGSTNAITLNFELPASGAVQLRIYSTDGALVRTLVDRDMAAGPQTATWDARDNSGNLVASGAYFYTISTASSGIASGKILIEGQ